MGCQRGAYCPTCSIHSRAEYIAHGGRLPDEACIQYIWRQRRHENCRCYTDPIFPPPEPRAGYIDGGTYSPTHTPTITKVRPSLDDVMRETQNTTDETAAALLRLRAAAVFTAEHALKLGTILTPGPLA